MVEHAELQGIPRCGIPRGTGDGLSLPLAIRPRRRVVIDCRLLPGVGAEQVNDGLQFLAELAAIRCRMSQYCAVHFTGLVDHPGAELGDGDELASAVGRAGLSADVGPCLQAGQGLAHGLVLDTDSLGNFGLAHGLLRSG